jgi:hypothetical protein
MRTGKARAQGIVAISCLVVGLLSGSSQAQIRQQAQDPVSIVGTWATGSGQVETGLVSLYSILSHFGH